MLSPVRDSTSLTSAGASAKLDAAAPARLGALAAGLELSKDFTLPTLPAALRQLLPPGLQQTLPAVLPQRFPLGLRQLWTTLAGLQQPWPATLCKLWMLAASSSECTLMMAT